MKNAIIAISIRLSGMLPIYGAAQVVPQGEGAE